MKRAGPLDAARWTLGEKAGISALFAAVPGYWGLNPRPAADAGLGALAGRAGRLAGKGGAHPTPGRSTPPGPKIRRAAPRGGAARACFPGFENPVCLPATARKRLVLQGGAGEAPATPRRAA